MLEQITKNAKIQKLFSLHAKDFAQVLSFEGIPFSLVCNTQMMSFEPKLPLELYEKIGKVSLFVLSGYSLQSLEFFENHLSFEAGLISNQGADIGTLLHVPYHAIVQILIQDEETSQPIPVFINPFDQVQNQAFYESMNAILSKNTRLR